MGGVCRTRGEMRKTYKRLVGKPDGKRPLGRSRRGWEDNDRINRKKIGCKGVDCIKLPQDRDR
jgi:hypothetical protein